MSVSYIAVSAVGRDRVGLADDIAAWIEAAGGNVEESKMAVLGGEFAVIMLVSGSSETTRVLLDGSENTAGRLGLRLHATETTAPNASSGGLPYTVETVSLDSPGIVHALTREIRAMGVNIADLETSSSAAPWTGAPVFRMKATLILPANLPVARFRENMEKLSHERDLDIRLGPV
jgi:glycine cleavage system transcriptional repressor